MAKRTENLDTAAKEDHCHNKSHCLLLSGRITCCGTYLVIAYIIAQYVTLWPSRLSNCNCMKFVVQAFLLSLESVIH